MSERKVIVDGDSEYSLIGFDRMRAMENIVVEDGYAVVLPTFTADEKEQMSKPDPLLAKPTPTTGRPSEDEFLGN